MLAAFCECLGCLPDAKEDGVICGTGAQGKSDIYRHSAYLAACEMGQ